jgi:general secretion pathway protein D
MAVLAYVLCASAAFADNDSTAPSASISSQDGAITISKLIAVVAKKTGKKFVLDPRVRADVVIIGQDVTSISYGDLLTVLHVHGFAAVEDGGYVQVISEANVRVMPVPPVTDKDTWLANEFVDAIVTVKHVSAAQLVPILRPLMPQYGHLAAYPCTNQLILSDTYSNVRRLEAMIRALDVGENLYKSSGCEPKENASSR